MHGVQGGRQLIRSSTAIMTGNRLVIHYIREQRDNEDTVIGLQERDWVRIEHDDKVIAATKEDILKVLSDVQTIHVRATLMTSMRELSISSARVTVGDVIREQCECPAQYNGTSCQSCAAGHYRDYSDFSCVECPCHGHEEACEQDGLHGEVVCTCDPVWVRQYCHFRPIDVRMRGPPMQSVRPGQTVKFDCGAKPQIKIEAPMSFQWSREGGQLPKGWSRDNGYGLLVSTTSRPPYYSNLRPRYDSDFRPDNRPDIGVSIEHSAQSSDSGGHWGVAV